MSTAKTETKAKTPQGFIKAYDKLCKEYGYQIVVQPAFRSRDDGTWSIVQQSSVGKLPEQKTS